MAVRLRLKLRIISSCDVIFTYTLHSRCVFILTLLRTTNFWYQGWDRISEQTRHMDTQYPLLGNHQTHVFCSSIPFPVLMHHRSSNGRWDTAGFMRCSALTPQISKTKIGTYAPHTHTFHSELGCQNSTGCLSFDIQLRSDHLYHQIVVFWYHSCNSVNVNLRHNCSQRTSSWLQFHRLSVGLEIFIPLSEGWSS